LGEALDLLVEELSRDFDGGVVLVSQVVNADVGLATSLEDSAVEAASPKGSEASRSFAGATVKTNVDVLSVRSDSRKPSVLLPLSWRQSVLLPLSWRQSVLWPLLREAKSVED
jgi:hypothetical protein